MSRISPDVSQTIEQLTALTKAKAFLGREFLLWLWYQIDISQGRMSVVMQKQKYDLNLWLDDRLVFASVSQSNHRSTMSGGDPAHSREAEVALMSGKSVREFKLGMEVNGAGPFKMNLGSDGFTGSGLALRSLNLPDPDPAPEDMAELTVVRLEQTMLVQKMIDTLFANFLEVRLQPAWEQSDLPAIRKWVRGSEAQSDVRRNQRSRIGATDAESSNAPI